MAMYELCERCDRREHYWTVREARIEIGEVNRRPHLCESCTVTVMSQVLAALRPVGRSGLPLVDPARLTDSESGKATGSA